MTSLVCSECRHENEPERVYCHSCGARLNRAAAKVRTDPGPETRKHLSKLFDPQRARLRALFFKVSKLALGALAVAVLVQIALPPDLPERSKGLMLASQLGLDLERAASHRQATSLHFTDEQVNAFLASNLKTKKKSLDEPLLEFQRVIVGFREGVCALTMERSLFGYSLYTTISVTPSIAGGKIAVINRGGHIGRLPIHPEIAQFMGLLFRDLWSALDRETKMVAKLGAIEFHDKSVSLSVAP